MNFFDRTAFLMERIVKSTLDWKSVFQRRARLGIQQFFFALIFLVYRESPGWCPVCDQRGVERFKKIRWHLLSLKLVRCKSCSLVRQAPRLTQKGLDLYYRFLYRSGTSALQAQELFERGQRRGAYILDFIQSCYPIDQNKTIVDVGCGYGGVLDHFRTVSKRVAGVDVDAAACQFARKKRLDVRQGGVDAIDQDQVDILICSHVLEHVPDPVRFLSIVAGKLSAPGQIFIEVPGIENPSVIENNLGVQPTHLTYFTRKTLIACCEKAHLDVV